MLKYRCKGPRKDETSMERRGCGADLTELIAVVAEDGRPHAIKCPKCGNMSSVSRVPLPQVVNG